MPSWDGLECGSYSWLKYRQPPQIPETYSIVDGYGVLYGVGVCLYVQRLGLRSGVNVRSQTQEPKFTYSFALSTGETSTWR